MRLTLLAAAAFVALAGCAQNAPGGYGPYQVGQALHTENGVITSSRQVQIAGAETGLGATVGAFAGSIAGAQIGPSRYSRYGRRHRYSSAASVIGAFGGAIVGGLIGSAIERDVSRQIATEYVVRMANGDLVTIVQGGEQIPAGQQVLLQSSGSGFAQIIPAV